jgi:hypothetical protein
MMPPNKEMQQTRHGSDGASLLISVFGRPWSESNAADGGRDRDGMAMCRS